jgi:uncharacterized protein DUF3716
LHEQDKSAVGAVTCHSAGDEMLSPCEDCQGGPFGSCVVYRNKWNNACSNCIFLGRERYCEWRMRCRLDSDDERDYVPPKTRRTGQARRAEPKRAKRRNNGFLPSKRQKAVKEEPEDGVLPLSELIDANVKDG